jgi:hypothetical protein
VELRRCCGAALKLVVSVVTLDKLTSIVIDQFAPLNRDFLRLAALAMEETIVVPLAVAVRAVLGLRSYSAARVIPAPAFMTSGVVGLAAATRADNTSIAHR